MALFPMSGVLRGFAPAACEKGAWRLQKIAPAACEKAVCGVLSVRLNENPCAALLIRREALPGNKTPHL